MTRPGPASLDRMSDEKSKLGLGGYDPITLFEGDEPKPGKFELRHLHAGKVYVFTNETHQGRFSRDPGRYLPQFGGHCAFAMGLYGGLVEGDIQFRKIVYGKLYLLQGPKAMWWWEKFPNFIPWGHAKYDKKFKLSVD